MVIIRLKTILNEEVGYHSCYNKKWFLVQNIKYRKNNQHFYQKLLAPRKKANVTQV